MEEATQHPQDLGSAQSYHRGDEHGGRLGFFAWDLGIDGFALMLILLGPGRYSLDAQLFQKR